MRRIWLIVGVTLLLLPWLVTGCGIAQEQYDAVVAERDKAQAELQSTKTELQSAETELNSTKTELQSVKGKLSSSKAEVSELTASLGKTKTELEVTQDEYEALKSAVKSTWDPLYEDLSLNSWVLSVVAALLLDDLDAIPSRAASVTTKVAATGDSELEALWEQAYVLGAEEWKLHFEPFEIFLKKHDERIGSKATEIRDELAELSE